MRTLPLLVALTLSASVAACSKSEEKSNSAAPVKVTEAVKAVEKPANEQAKELFDSVCSTCHGKTGDGDGPGAAALEPKPRAFSDATWQGSVTDDDLKKVILGGGPSVGKSPLMPPNPVLQTKPEVLDELVKMVRGFKRGEAAPAESAAPAASAE